MDPLAQIVHRDAAYRVGKALTGRLREVIPRQQFKIPIQAAIGVKVVASENLSGDLLSPLGQLALSQQLLVHSTIINHLQDDALPDWGCQAVLALQCSSS